MSTLILLGIALGLAIDAFAVAVACSVCLGDVTPRQAFRLSFHFGLFQALMPLVGWLAGRTVEPLVRSWDHWAAFALLALVGGKAILSALREGVEERPANDPTRGIALVTLSVATSIDALAVGFSFALLSVSIWAAVAVIGVVAAAATLVGMVVGGRLGARFGRRLEVAGGLVLIGIGVKIVLDHSLGG